MDPKLIAHIIYAAHHCLL